MGATYFRGYSKQDVIEHVSKSCVTGQCNYRTLTTYLVGNVLWAVVELIAKIDGFRDFVSGDGERFIACYLLDESGSGWGYKDLVEAMSPYHYSCPLQYLEMTPEKCPRWRANVREWHVQQHGSNAGKLVDDQLRVMSIDDVHMLSLEAFANRSTALRNKNIPRKWTVYFGETKRKDCYDEIHRDFDRPFVVWKFKPNDYYSGENIRKRNFDFLHAFSDAETEEDAIRSVHWGAVNNALLAHTPEGRRMERAAFPSPDVLSLYPDLVAKFPDAFQADVLID